MSSSRLIVAKEPAINCPTSLEVALSLSVPVKIADDKFSIEEKRLDLYIDLKASSTFSCPLRGA